jgi:hypothetical protein
MAEVRISELTAHSTGVLAATDLIEVSEDLGGGLFGSRKLTGLLLSGGVSSKVFKAKFEQVGTHAPTLTIIRNDFGGTITTSRSIAGGYAILGFNSQLVDNVEISFNMSSLDINGEVLANLPTSSTIAVSTYASGVQADDVCAAGQTYLTVTKYL